MDVAALPWTDFNGRFPADQYQNFVVDASTISAFGNNWVEGDNGWDLHLAESCRYQEDINTCELPVFRSSMAATECQKYLQVVTTLHTSPASTPSKILQWRLSQL